MKAAFLGDSYDIVKQSLLRWLGLGSRLRRFVKGSALPLGSTIFFFPTLRMAQPCGV